MRQKLTTILLLILSLSALAFGQAGADTSKGSVIVDVQDISGGSVANAPVTLSGPDGNRKTTSDSRGQAQFYGIIPGAYTLIVESPGFRRFEGSNINVLANQKTPIEVKLQPGAVTETVQVSENVATVDTSSTTIGTSITQDQFRNIPVQRNIASLISLTPGASPGLGTDNLNSPKESFNPSISGATGLENLYIIDGINATDTGYGSFGVWSLNYGSLGSGVNFDFVKEIQVNTGGFEAQYGQALGGIINIVTLSGGNKLTGSVYAYSGPGWAEGEYKQPNALRISSPTTELLGRHSYDYGFNIGGHFIKDKFFWYGGINPTFNAIGRQAPLNFGARALGPQQWETRSLNWVGKLNYNLSDNHRLEGTAFGDPSHDSTGVHQSLLRDDLNNASSADYGTRNWAVKYNGVLPATTLINASFGWNRSNFDEIPSQPGLASIRDYSKAKPNAVYTFTGGLGLLENNIGNNKQYNVMITKNVNLFGSHQIDIGYGYNQIDYTALRFYTGGDTALPAGAGIAAGDVGKLQHGGYYYFYPSRKVAGVPYQNVYRLVRGNFSSPNIGTNSGYQDAFAQDAYKINRFVTIKAGVRWEQQKISGTDTKYTFGGNWAPRMGLIFDPTGSRKTRIFANYGLFFEKIPQDLAVRAQSSEQSYNNIYSFGLPQTAANLVPGTKASPVGTDPTIIAGGTKAQFQEEEVAGIERELSHGVVVSARYIHRQIQRVLEDISGITVEQALAGSGQQYVIANPNLAQDIFHNATECSSGPNCDTDAGFTLDSGQLGADGKSDGFPDPRRVYNAMELTAEKRFGNNWSLLANYRLSKSFGNYEGNFRNDNGQSDPNITSLFDFAYSKALADQFRVGVLPSDRRHVINLFGNYLFFHRLNVGLGFQSLAGVPITKLLAHPAYANAGELPSGPRGSAGQTPWQNYVDAHLDYQVPLKYENLRLKIAADVFNIFDRRTVVSVDQNFELAGTTSVNNVPTNADYLKPLQYHRPTYARFSLRLEF